LGVRKEKGYQKKKDGARQKGITKKSTKINKIEKKIFKVRYKVRNQIMQKP